MRIIEKISEMQQQSNLWRQQGKTIALVPTMGYFHEGHLALMRHARKLGDILGVSLFVNPTQFGPGEDYERYPRDEERDIQLAKSVGVDFLFMPQVSEMYPEGYQTYVEVTEITKALCGLSRPGHFRGVTTVVAKLFNIIKPHIAVFGEKDFQQLVVIRRMVKDLNMDVTIVGHPTVREQDGLAMSSRNTYLDPEQRRQALALSKALREAQSLVSKGERDAKVITMRARDILEQDGKVRIDYVEVCDPQTFQRVDTIERPTLLAVAAYVGKARLIDNMVLQPAQSELG